MHYFTIKSLHTSFVGIAIKLVGGNLHNEGRVEVYHNGEWGTVCDDGWDDIDAGVVCAQLGFNSSGTAIRSAAFGQGSGPIWLDNVMCVGNESSLAYCIHLGLNVTRNCSHSEDAGVRCFGSQGKVFYLLNNTIFTSFKFKFFNWKNAFNLKKFTTI